MDEEDVLFQGFLHKLKLPKSGRFNRLGQERWKMKYFVLSCLGSQLVLKSFNKKPKQLQNCHPRKQIHLCPSFKVEKLSNCHNRAFALQLTAPSCQVCLSANEQSTVDMLVFLLQTQIRLRDNIQDNLIGVKTEPSEAFTRIGARGANCVLHTSPWGLTLLLQQSRVVLAQWPLKSIRYYESSGQGQFIIEAGMVAPMGEGIYQFRTMPGLDNRLYDTVDHYVINTLDRVKPNQRGTPEEIKDYIREFDCLHSLTVLTPSPVAGNEEVSRVLRDNWGSTSQAMGSTDPRVSQSSNISGNADAINRLSSSESAPSVLQHSVSAPLPSSPTSPLVSNNLNRPLPSPHSPRSEQQRQSPHTQRGSPRQKTSPASGDKGRVSGRPPPPPPRNGPQGSSRLNRGFLQSSRQDSVDGVGYPQGFEAEPRRHSNPASVALKVTHSSDVHPAMRKQMSYDSGAEGMLDNNLSHLQRHPPGSPQTPSPSSARSSGERSSCPVGSASPRVSGAETTAGREHKLEAPVEDWLVSASCEDLSDHMRAVIFHKQQSQQPADTSPSPEPTENENTANNNDPDFIPPPFTGIMDFRANNDWDRSRARDRSQSFDVNSKLHKNVPWRNGAASGSSSPSIKQIRKMVSARTATKENLKKSLSNPNFLNLGSKEKLHQHRLQVAKSSHLDKEESSKLSAQNKPKSRSLANLLPSSLRRYISKESLSHPPSTSPSPEIRHRQQRGNKATPADSEPSNFRRQYSARSLKEMSIKGIHFTEQSRSFRKPKGTQRSRSAEPGGRSHQENNSHLVQDSDIQHSPSTEQRNVRNSGNISHEGMRPNSGNGSYTNNDVDGKFSPNGAREVNDRRNPVHRQTPDSDWKIRLPSRTTSQSSC